MHRNQHYCPRKAVGWSLLTDFVTLAIAIFTLIFSVYLSRLSKIQYRISRQRLITWSSWAPKVALISDIFHLTSVYVLGGWGLRQCCVWSIVLLVHPMQIWCLFLFFRPALSTKPRNRKLVTLDRFKQTIGFRLSQLVWVPTIRKLIGFDFHRKGITLTENM